jgi:hypothetical protein
MEIDGSVSRKELLKVMKELASIEASKRTLDEWEIENLEYEAIEVIYDIFDSLRYKKKNKKADDYESLEGWPHRSSSNYEDDWKLLGIDRTRIQIGVKNYLNNDWMHNTKTDWLILNVLNYAELQAFKEFTRANILSPGEYLEKKMDYLPRYKNAHLFRPFKNLLYKLFALFIWALILVYLIAYYLDLPIVSIIVGVLVVIWDIFAKIKRTKDKRKIRDIQDEIESTYNVCANLNMSWDLIWDSMIKSKDKMVVWDNLVYSLVEKRRKENV